MPKIYAGMCLMFAHVSRWEMAVKESTAFKGNSGLIQSELIIQVFSPRLTRLNCKSNVNVMKSQFTEKFLGSAVSYFCCVATQLSHTMRDY